MLLVLQALLILLCITNIDCRSVVAEDESWNKTVDALMNNPQYTLTGFARGIVGGGTIAESDSRYRKVSNAQDFYNALNDKNSKVIEITNDLNLGYNEIPSGIRGNLFARHNDPKTHPKLIQTGVSKVYIQDRNGLTIFSDKGATIRHANLIVKRMQGLIIRNLKFAELWEWDEDTKGDYDRNDWDYITIEDSDGVWLDHLEFGKAYDGIVDIKAPSKRVTISWSLARAANNGQDPFYVQQFDHLEANRARFTGYNYLRNLGISKSQIQQVMSPQKKGHLIGGSELRPENGELSATIHNSVYIDLCDRLPRLRAGNVHVFNVISDFRVGQAAKKLRNSLPSTPSYKFAVTSQALISTENGAVRGHNLRLLDVSTPVINNQKSASDSRYTGKIELSSSYHSLNGVTYEGSSTSSNSPLRPTPANIIPFTWNGFSSIPYTYSSYLLSQSQLESVLRSSSTGAGAKNLGWAKSNWLKTSY